MNAGKIFPTVSVPFWPRTINFAKAQWAIALLTLVIGCLCGEGTARALENPGSGFVAVQSALQRAGFAVKLTEPPQAGAYGLFRPATRTIWIHPVVFELGIAEQTIVHEATHAAQFCRGQGTLTALKLPYQAPAQARRLFQRYNPDQFRSTLEAEAYAVQAQEDRIEQVLKLLQQHCGSRK